MMEIENKSFEQLVKEKATCFEFALHGYIRIYEKNEEPCKCRDCKLARMENEERNKKWHPHKSI